jgi:hypothetical protein
MNIQYGPFYRSYFAHPTSPTANQVAYATRYSNICPTYLGVSSGATFKMLSGTATTMAFPTIVDSGGCNFSTYVSSYRVSTSATVSSVYSANLSSASITSGGY